MLFVFHTQNKLRLRYAFRIFISWSIPAQQSSKDWTFLTWIWSPILHKHFVLHKKKTIILYTASNTNKGNLKSSSNIHVLSKPSSPWTNTFSTRQNNSKHVSLGFYYHLTSKIPIGIFGSSREGGKGWPFSTVLRQCLPIYREKKD